MVIIDNDALTHILQSIEEKIGLSIERIVAEAKRKSGKDFIDKVLSGPKGFIARNLASKKVYEQLTSQVNMLGYGRAEVTAYTRKSFLEGRIESAYNGPALTGDIAGAFESVEQKVGEYEFNVDEGGTLRLAIRASEGIRPEYENRFSYVPVDPLPGRNIIELCPSCRAPIELGKQYEFDLNHGTIRERKTGHRVVLIGVMTLYNLFGELTSELGDEIPEMIMSIEKERVKGVIGSKGKELDSSENGYIRYMKTLQLKGMGNGVMASINGQQVKVRIDNPYYEPLLAGFISGFYEITNQIKSRVKWTSGTVGFTEITVEPE
jgi:hypothetical protein